MNSALKRMLIFQTSISTSNLLGINTSSTAMALLPWHCYIALQWHCSLTTHDVFKPLTDDMYSDDCLSHILSDQLVTYVFDQ